MPHLPVPVVVPAACASTVLDGGSTPQVPENSVWKKMSRVPITLVLSGAFGLGCALLHWYLVSIDYVPTDLLALLGLATLVSAWLAFLWVFLTLVLFATVFVVMLYEVEPPRFPILLLGQTSGVLCMLGLLFRQHVSGPYLFAAATIVALFCFAQLLAERPARKAGPLAMSLLAMLFGGALIPLGVLLLALTGGSTPAAWQWESRTWVAGSIVLLAILLLVNAKAVALKHHPLVIWVATLFATAVVFMSAVGWQAVPTILAERVGIRLVGSSTLVVPASTCRLIAVGLALKDTAERVRMASSCEAEAAVVVAQVQLRWAGRWLLAVDRVNDVPVPNGASRVTIPDEGTQLVLKSGQRP